MKTVALIPIKINNERLPGKNTKLLGGIPLMHHVQQNLLSVDGIDEIYCYCSSDAIHQYLLGGISFLRRSAELDFSETTSNDILKAFTAEVNADIYVFAMATAPFINPANIQLGVDKVKGGEFDSAFSVESLKEFIWDNGKPVNFTLDNIPRTQDLPKLYIESSGFYVFTRAVVKTNGRRVGEKPYLVELSKFECIDIDYPEDFQIAEAIYWNIISKEASSLPPPIKHIFLVCFSFAYFSILGRCA